MLGFGSAKNCNNKQLGSNKELKTVNVYDATGSKERVAKRLKAKTRNLLRYFETPDKLL